MRLKSRNTWLTTRDINTKFFHISTIIRHRRNAIEFLKKEDGGWILTQEEIGDYITSYFSTLFQSNYNVIPADLEGLVSPQISQVENEALCVVPYVEEIWKVVTQIGS